MLRHQDARADPWARGGAGDAGHRGAKQAAQAPGATARNRFRIELEGNVGHANHRWATAFPAIRPEVQAQ